MSIHKFPSSRSVDDSGSGGDNGNMEARVTKLETTIPTLATKLDVAELRSDMHKELHSLTWKLIGSQAALVAAVFFIAKYIK